MKITRKNFIAFDRATGTLSVAVPAKPGEAYKVRFITTKRGVKVDPVKTVEIPAKGGKETSRRVPVYSDGVGAVAKTVTFGTGEPVDATLLSDGTFVFWRGRLHAGLTMLRSFSR